MALTYKALDLLNQRYVAVKQLRFEKIQEWKTLEMFEREAKILQHLKHHSIPEYIDYFMVETSSEVQFVLIQQYVEGSTIQQLVESGWRKTEAEIIEIFFQLLDVLSYLHSLHPPVIHRDINPKNIILSPDGQLYLVDFGAVQDIIRTTFLGGSTIIGTFGYIPFEQFTGCAMPASDYYAAGATLLYMLTHRHPSDFPIEQMTLNFQTHANVSPNVERLLHGLLTLSPDSRIASKEQASAILDAAMPQKSLANNPPRLKKVSAKNHLRFYLYDERSKEMRVVLGFSSLIIFFFAAFLVMLTSNSQDLLLGNVPHVFKLLMEHNIHNFLIASPYYDFNLSEVWNIYVTQYVLPLITIPLVGIAIRLLFRSLKPTYLHTLLEVSPKRLKISDKGFGGMTRRIPLRKITEAYEIPHQRGEIYLPERIKINAFQLTQAERTGLIHELNTILRQHHAKCY